MEVVKVAVNAV